MGKRLSAALSRLGQGDAGLQAGEVRQAFHAAEEDFNEYVRTYGTPLEKEVARLKEKVEILDGTRNMASSPKAAVRRQDLNPMQRVPVSTVAKPVTGTVTAAQYNDLLKDVRSLHEALRSLALLSERKTV